MLSENFMKNKISLLQRERKKIPANGARKIILYSLLIKFNFKTPLEGF